MAKTETSRQTGCALRTVFAFAVALLRPGRSRRWRGVMDVNAVVGPDASAGIHDWLGSLHRRPRQTRLLLSLLLNRHRQPVCRSSLQHCSVMGGGDLRGGVNLKRRNAMRRFTRSQAAARIADRTAKNCRGHVT